MKHKYVFIITYGRSGSTLLMGVLNSIKNYRIMGENYNAIYDLFGYYKKMVQSMFNNKYNMDVHSLVGSTNPWWNSFDEHELRQNIKSLVDATLNRDNFAETIGFKEIRYVGMSESELSDYLLFLDTVFKPKFIFLTRDKASVVKSKWWANDDDALKKITDFEDNMRKIMFALPFLQIHHVDYEHICANELDELFKFLREDYYKERVAEVLKTQHSY